MSKLLTQERGRVWEPLRLGRSLPVADGMRRTRYLFLALGALAVALAFWICWGILFPSVETLTESRARELVVGHLAKIPQTTTEGHRGLPPWALGGNLGVAEPPDFLVVRPAGLALKPHPRDPSSLDYEQLRQGRSYLEDEDYIAASSIFGRAADAQPTSWLWRYNAGMVAFESGQWGTARGDFEKAYRLLDKRPGNDPGHLAALAVTRYSMGLALLRQGVECEEGIVNLKRSINALGDFVAQNPAGVFARSEDDLFPVDPFEFDSYKVRNALVESYLHCERYPSKYFEKRPWANDFHESEYSDPRDAEILEGPFPEALARCVEEEEPERKCWALSNLNQTYHASKTLLPLEGEEPKVPERLRESYGSLVQMAYNIAVLMGQEVGEAPVPVEASGTEASDTEGANGESTPRRTAVDFLVMAAKLNEQVGDADFEARIEQYGRHLATTSEDLRLLALPYRNMPLADMRFEPDSTAVELRGMAGAIEQRFESYLRDGTPENMAEGFATLRSNLTSQEHLRSFDAWRGEVEKTLQNTLAEAMVFEDRRGRSETSGAAPALGIRNYRAPFLGEDWGGRSWRAWMTWGRSLTFTITVVAVLVWILALILIYRMVVFPYLVYNSSFYASEFTRRHKDCKAQQKAFTAEEVRRREELRGS